MGCKRIAAALLIAILTVALFSTGAGANQSIAVEFVRIGLYYGETASSSAVVSAVNGLSICRSGNDGIKVLVPNVRGKITVRKDAWFYRSNNVLKEYLPAQNVPGEKYGPYHLRIITGCADYSDAMIRAEALKAKGVPAYPAFTGKWEVWAGFYTASEQALIDAAKFRSAAGVPSIDITGPPAGRVNPGIVIENEEGNTLLVYSDTAATLHIRPDESNDPRIFSINGSRYRGALEFRRQDGSDMTVINLVDVESYLYGVVACEMQSWAPIEALKCQAVVARNYTYSNLNKFSKWGFDLDTTVQTQIYKGFDAETPATNRAVDETRGIVLWYGDRLAQCFYFSSSGGRTEDVKNVWGSDFPYLKSVEDPYESGTSAYYTWTKTLTAREVQDCLKRRGYDVGEVSGIDIVKRSEAGRAVEIKVTGTRGSVTLMREACRTVFGLYSQWFDVSSDTGVSVASQSRSAKTVLPGLWSVKSDGSLAKIAAVDNKTAVVAGDGSIVYIASSESARFTFTGRGYGHAVGMSQEGAKGFANLGKKYDEILLHYFPGTYIDDIYRSASLNGYRK